jgi:hypothetical protein
MPSPRAVLLPPSKSSALTQLPFYKQFAPISPLFTSLVRSAQLFHSTPFSRPLFSYSYELFCVLENLNSFISSHFQSPPTKTWGWGPSRLKLLNHRLNFSPNHQKLSRSFVSTTYKLPIFYPLSFHIHPCNGGYGPLLPSQHANLQTFQPSNAASAPPRVRQRSMLG